MDHMPAVIAIKAIEKLVDAELALKHSETVRDSIVVTQERGLRRRLSEI